MVREFRVHFLGEYKVHATTLKFQTHIKVFVKGHSVLQEDAEPPPDDDPVLPRGDVFANVDEDDVPTSHPTTARRGPSVSMDGPDLRHQCRSGSGQKGQATDLDMTSPMRLTC